MQDTLHSNVETNQEILISPQKCKSKKYDSFLLAIDLGGTKINAALCAKKEKEKNWEILFVQTFETKKIQNINEIFFQMQKISFAIYTEKYTSASVGIAGPLSQDKKHAYITNVGWNISSKDIQKKHKLSSVILLNDLEAVGNGLFSLSQKDFLKLDNLPNIDTEQRGILAAGTGLGVAIISLVDNLDKKNENYIEKNEEEKNHKEQRYMIHPAEGGHIPFAAITQEDKLLQIYLEKKLKRTMTYEDLVSGRGIISIYDFLTRNTVEQNINKQDTHKKKVNKKITNKQNTNDQSTLHKKIQSLDGALKIQLIQKNIEDSVCKKTFNLFIRYYAQFAQTFALFTLPRGGIYIGGGIARKIQNILLKSNFRKIFEDNTKMKNVLKEIPLRIITNKYVALIGCCNAFEERKR